MGERDQIITHHVHKRNSATKREEILIDCLPHLQLHNHINNHG